MPRIQRSCNLVQSSAQRDSSLGSTSANPSAVNSVQTSVSWAHVGQPSTERLSPPRMTNPGVVENRHPQPKDTWAQHNSPWISDTKASFISLVAFVGHGLHISASSQLDRLLCSKFSLKLRCCLHKLWPNLPRKLVKRRSDSQG